MTATQTAFDRTAEPRLGRACVLVADDHEAARLMFASVLRQDGHDVEAFEDADSLLDRIAYMAPLPDLVVTDVRMPRFSGIDALRAIRDASLAIPVVLVTGVLDGEIEDEAARLDAAILEKPVDPDALRAVVRDLLDRAGFR